MGTDLLMALTDDWSWGHFWSAFVAAVVVTVVVSSWLSAYFARRRAIARRRAELLDTYDQGDYPLTPVSLVGREPRR